MSFQQQEGMPDYQEGVDEQGIEEIGDQQEMIGGEGMQDSQGLDQQGMMGDEQGEEDMENQENSEMQSESGQMSQLPINLS